MSHLLNLLICQWILTVSISWLLYIILLWAWGNSFPFWHSVFISFGNISRGWIAGSYGNYILIFLRTLHTVFHNGCTNLQSHQQYTRVLLYSIFLLTHLFLMITLPRGMRWSFIVALICISLMVSGLVMLSTFSCTCRPFVFLLWEMSLHVLCLFFFFFFFCYRVIWVIFIFYIVTPF